MTHPPLEHTVTVVGQLQAAHIGKTLELDHMIVLQLDQVLHLRDLTLIANTNPRREIEWYRFTPETSCRITTQKSGT